MGIRPPDVSAAPECALRPTIPSFGGSSTGVKAEQAGARITLARTVTSRRCSRLTRLRPSAEQPVNLDDDDDVYNWPWLCAGEMGDWKLTDAQAAKLREYLLRGGFLCSMISGVPRSGIDSTRA